MIPDFRGVQLAQRRAWAKANLEKIAPKYAVLWETPFASKSEPLKITVYSPNWLACAVAGGILPDVQTYLDDYRNEAAFIKKYGKSAPFEYAKVGGAKHPFADPIDAMTEEKAVEYIIQSSLPEDVWKPRHNRQTLKIVRCEDVPEDRTYRKQWKLDNLEIEAA